MSDHQQQELVTRREFDQYKEAHEKEHEGHEKNHGYLADAVITTEGYVKERFVLADHKEQQLRDERAEFQTKSKADRDYEKVDGRLIELERIIAAQRSVNIEQLIAQKVQVAVSVAISGMRQPPKDDNGSKGSWTSFLGGLVVGVFCMVIGRQVGVI